METITNRVEFKIKRAFRKMDGKVEIVFDEVQNTRVKVDQNIIQRKNLNSVGAARKLALQLIFGLIVLYFIIKYH